jgi:biotin operon repressor
MLYHRSFEIEQRLDIALRLIRMGRFSTPKLAEQLSVSIPTVSRCVTALRARGHPIRAERKAGSWRYVLASEPISPDHRARSRKQSTDADPR